MSLLRGDAACSTVSLQYIDYGNSDQQMVGQIRFLPDKMKEAPAAAYKCKLVNVSGALNFLQLQIYMLFYERDLTQGC